MPGVTESNNSLFYQGKPLSILLDGKSNSLSGEDLKNYLSGILGTNTDKLEILLNPSSKYDAQGGAVFNIHSPKNKNYGFTESVTIGAGSGTYFKYPAGIAINYRDSNINIYGGYDYNRVRQFYHLDAALQFNSAPATIHFIDHDVRDKRFNTFRFGVDYDISKKTTIGLLFKYQYNYRPRHVLNESVYSPGTGKPDTIVSVATGGYASFKMPSVNLFLKTKLSSKGTELTVNADYFGYHKKWDDDIKTGYTDKYGNTTASSDYLISRSPADNSVKSITADLFQLVKKGSIESGLKITESKTDNNVLWQQFLNNNWKTDSGKTNHFIYKEDVYATYLNVIKNYKKLTVQAGLRFEATRSNGISVTINKVTTNTYNDFFPSLSFQYRPVKNQQFLINFRRSIKRFGFDILNPFILTQGQYSYHQGNPYIKPSYFSAVDLAWSYKSKLVIGAGFSAVKNPMSYAYRKYDSANASIGTYLNFGAGRLYTGNISYTEKLFKGKLTSINSINFLHSQLPDFYSNMQYYNSYSFNTVNTITLPSKISMELSALYNSSFLDGTVLQSGYYVVNIGFSKPVLKSKGSLKLSCNDIFNTQIIHNRTQGLGIHINAYWHPESRFVNLLFTYRFGNLNVKANKNRKTGIEDEKSRMGVN